MVPGVVAFLFICRLPLSSPFSLTTPNFTANNYVHSPRTILNDVQIDRQTPRIENQMNSLEEFTGSESSEVQVRMKLEPHRVDDVFKSSGGTNKIKRPIALVPFLNALRSTSQEVDTDLSPDDGTGEKLSGVKVSDAYNVGGIGDSLGGHSIGNNLHLIRCVCNTSDCVQRIEGINGNATCLTSGMCYTQILDYGDGRPPVSKGCISGGIGENLLCENRKPKNAKLWPRVSCCNTDLCNAGAFQTRKVITTIASTDITTSINHNSVVARNEHDEKLNVEDAGKDAGGRHEKAKSDSHPHNEDAFEVWNNMNLKKSSGSSGNISPLISPLASSFLIGGAVVVVVISAIGFYILRREQSHATLYYNNNLDRHGRDDAAGTDGPRDEDHESSSHYQTIKDTSLNLIYESIPPSESDGCHSHLLQLCAENTREENHQNRLESELQV